MKQAAKSKQVEDSKGIGALHERPGVLFRRAHQIAVSLFVEACAPLGLTPPQHSILFAANARPNASHAELARSLGFDRVTVGKVVQSLVERGLLSSEQMPDNRRDRALRVTPEGKRLLRSAEKPVHDMSQRLLSPLTPKEQAQLMKLMLKLTTGLNEASRTPVAVAREENAAQ